MIQNQAGAGLAPLGNFCNIAGRPVTSTPLSEMFGHQVVLQNAQGCQTGTGWFQ